MHKPTCQRQACRWVSTQPELFHPGEDVLQLVPPRDTVEPAAHGEVSHRDFQLTEHLDGLGRNLDITKKRHVRHVTGPDFFQRLLGFLDHEQFLGAADAQPRRVEVQHALVIAGGHESARRTLRASVLCFGQQARFIWQADGVERTAHALWRGDERRRDRLCRGSARGGNAVDHPRLQLRRHLQRHALLRAPVVDDPLLAAVAVVAQDKHLQAKLHPVRVPEFHTVFALARGACLIVHRANLRYGK